MFYIKCFDDTRHLLSFPTRRSSDLSTHTLEVAETMCDRIAIIHGGKIVAHGSMAEVQEQTSAIDPWATILRSEEHTSELQSHSELVCRLLPEKQKPTLSCRTSASKP